VTFDESFRLEPTQLAGFSQSFRNLISESVVGSVTAPTYETIGAALDLKFKSRTYVGIQGQFLNSEVNREVGVFDFSGALPPPPPIQPSSTAEHLDYDEYSTAATINQLISTSWSLESNTFSPAPNSIPCSRKSLSRSARELIAWNAPTCSRPRSSPSSITPQVFRARGNTMVPSGQFRLFSGFARR